MEHLKAAESNEDMQIKGARCSSSSSSKKLPASMWKNYDEHYQAH